MLLYLLISCDYFDLMGRLLGVLWFVSGGLWLFVGDFGVLVIGGVGVLVPSLILVSCSEDTGDVSLGRNILSFITF